MLCPGHSYGVLVFPPRLLRAPSFMRAVLPLREIRSALARIHCTYNNNLLVWSVVRIKNIVIGILFNPESLTKDD